MRASSGYCTITFTWARPSRPVWPSASAVIMCEPGERRATVSVPVLSSPSRSDDHRSWSPESVPWAVSQAVAASATMASIR